MLITIPKRRGFFLFDANDAMWYIEHGRMTTIGTAPYSATAFARSSDGQFLIVGSSQGAVYLYDTQSLQEHAVATFTSDIWSVAISASNDQIAVIAEHSAHIIDLTTIVNRSAAGARMRITWDNVNLRPRSVSFSKDGNWVSMTCEDGTVWFYHVQTKRWTNIRLSKANIFWGEFSDDSQRFLTTDSTGQVVIIETNHLLH
jgi:WD40 repeat protein